MTSRSYVSSNQADDLFPFGAPVALAASGTQDSAPVLIAGNRFLAKMKWTGTPTGTFTVQTAYDQTASAEWTTFSGATVSAQPAGSASNCIVEAVNLPGRYVRVRYTATSGTGTLSARATQHLMASPGASTSSPAQTAQIVPVASSANAWSIAMSTALAASLVIKASAGNLRSLSGRIDSTHATGTYYLQLWNLAALPADATAVGTGNSLMAPVKMQHVTGTDSKFSLDFPDSVYGSAGIVLGLSTTEFTKTASGAFLSATAEYK